MIKKLLNIYRRHEEAIAYLFFGGLTTVVNYVVCLPCEHWLKVCGIEPSGLISNVIAWVAAVAFAFLTNKPFVFKSHDWSAKVLWSELSKFLGCRVGSLVLESAIIFVTVDLLAWSLFWMKLVTNVMVVILNYIGSKLLVFRKKK